MTTAQLNDPGASILNSWLNLQKAYLDNWATIAEQVTSNAQNTPAYREQLFKVIMQNLDAWTNAADPISRSVAEQFISLQQNALQVLQFTARAWAALSPESKTSEELGEDLRIASNELLDSWRQYPENYAQTAQDLDRLWQLFIQQWQSLGFPWLSVLQKTPELFVKFLQGESSGFVEFSQVYRQAYQETFGRLISSPGLGPTRELSSRILQGFDRFVEWQLAEREYQAVITEIWNQALANYIETLVEMAEQGNKIESVRDLILLWTRGAEKIFTDGFRTEKYVLAQGKMLNGAMAYRIQQRLILEELLKLYDLPTRSELDETHRRIYELGKQLKELNKSLQKVTSKIEGE